MEKPVAVVSVKITRQAAARAGRPRGPTVDPATVVALRAKGLSWAEIANQLGCLVGAARFAASRYAVNRPNASIVGSAP